MYNKNKSVEGEGKRMAYRLIVVEDETKIREGIINLFPWSNTGFEVVGGFPDGEQALAYIERQAVDVVLTDIRMPRMDGLELARQIEASGKAVTVVFLSAYQDFDYLHHAIVHGVKDYLVKPINYDELIACFTRIREQLDKARPETAAEEEASYYQHVLRSVQQYVDGNLQTATLVDAALRVNLSPSYLSRVFRERTGQSFTDYLVEARMKKAAQLLHSIEFRLCEISEIVGYNSPKNFSRAFRNYYHMSPKEYRDQE